MFMESTEVETGSLVTTHPAGPGIQTSLNSSSVGSWTDQTRSSKGSRYNGQGQLKVVVTLTGNTLVLNIEEASGLKSQWKNKCSSYAQAQICPDEQGKSRNQTKTVAETNNPVYSHTVTYDLDTLDSLQKKRVMISVWHQDPVKNCAEFIGCLSFGLSHLVSKCRKHESTQGASGWYYLLSAEIGHRKHILARTVEGGDSETSVSQLEKDENKENQPQKWQHITFVMKHRSPGYGFTVRGPNPIRVGRIKVGGPAHETGMRKGDVIHSINGQKMESTDMQRVAEIIRKSDVEVTIDVSRKLALKLSSPEESVIANNKLTPMSLKSKLVDTMGQMKRKCDFSDEEFNRTSKKSPAFTNAENGNMFDEGMFCKPCGKRMLPVDIPKWAEDSIVNEKLSNIYSIGQHHHCDHVKFISNQLDSKSIKKSSKLLTPTAEKCQALTEKNVMKLPGSDVLAKYSKWNPEISCITTASSRVQDLVESVASEDNCLSYNPLNTRLDGFSCSSSSLSGNVNSNKDCEQSMMSQQNSLLSLTQDNATLEYPSRSSSPASSFTESRVADMTDFDNITSLGGSHLHNNTSVECSINSENELRRDLSVRTLIKCEEEYLKCMQKGIQTYSRPLRFCVLSTEQNEVLFQNIEKLATISQFNLSKMLNCQLLSDQSVNNSMKMGQCQTEDIGHIYHSTITMLCQGYMEYIDGLQPALSLLNKLRQNPEFEQTLQKQRSQCDRDILDFLQQPLLHFDFLHRAFEDIYSLTSTEHRDFQSMQSVVDKFAEAFSVLF